MGPARIRTSVPGSSMRQHHIKGFTILEMLVVIMIIAFMTTIVGVNLHGKQSSDLESVGRTLIADLRYVRSKALVGSADTAITIDVSGKNYFSQDATISRSFPQEISVVITVDEKDISESKGKIVFYPDGSSSGGKIKLTKDGRELEVVTTWLNGYVTMR
jgi:general secretion pathway protein H